MLKQNPRNPTLLFSCQVMSDSATPCTATHQTSLSFTPRTARRSNQSILKKINHEYSLEGLMVKFQYFGHLVWKVNSLEKTLMLKKIEDKRRGQQRMKWLNSSTDSMDTNLSKLWEKGEERGAWHAAVHWVTNSRTQLSDWMTTPPPKFITMKQFLWKTQKSNKDLILPNNKKKGGGRIRGGDKRKSNTQLEVQCITLKWQKDTIRPRRGLLWQLKHKASARKIPWRRKWQPSPVFFFPVFLPGEFHGQRSLRGYSPWSCKESDTTELLTLSDLEERLWKGYNPAVL